MMPRQRLGERQASLCAGSLRRHREDAEVVRIGAELLVASAGDVEAILDAQSPAFRPINARLDREHHALADRSRAGLMRIRRFVRTRANAMCHRMRRLPGVSALRDTGTDESIEFRQGSSSARKISSFV